MARIELLASRDTDTGSSRAHDAECDSLQRFSIFRKQMRKGCARQTKGIRRKKSEFNPQV